MKKHALIILATATLILSISVAQPHQNVVVVPLGFNANASAQLQNIITVSKDNGDFTSLSEAVNSVRNPSEDNPYLVYVGPGLYDVSSPIILPSYVNLVGSGENITMLVSKIPDSTTSMISATGESTISDFSMYGEYRPIFPSPTLIGAIVQTNFNGQFLKLKNLDLRMFSNSTSRQPIAIDVKDKNIAIESVSISVQGENGLGFRSSAIGSELSIKGSTISATTAVEYDGPSNLYIRDSSIGGQTAINASSTFAATTLKVSGSSLIGDKVISTSGGFYSVIINNSTVSSLTPDSFVGENDDKFFCTGVFKDGGEVTDNGIFIESHPVLLSDSCGLPD